MRWTSVLWRHAGGRQQRGQHLGAAEGLVGGAEVAAVEVVAGAALVSVDREVGSTGALGEADDLVRRDDAVVDLRSELRRDRQVEERLGDEDGITRRPGDGDRFLGPRPDPVGGVDIGTPDDRQATEQRGPEVEFLRRQCVECVLEPAHPWEIGHERGDPQVGADLGPRPGEGVRAPARQLCGLLVELQRGVEVAEPAQDLGQVEGHVRAQFLAADAFLADVSGSPEEACGAAPAGRRRPARWPPAHAASTAAPTAVVPDGGPQPVPGGGRPPVERADGVPRRRQPLVHVASVAEPGRGLGEQRVVEAHAARRHLVEHALRAPPGWSRSPASAVVQE